MTFAEGKALSEIPADQPNTTMAWGAQFANKILVTVREVSCIVWLRRATCVYKGFCDDARQADAVP